MHIKKYLTVLSLTAHIALAQHHIEGKVTEDLRGQVLTDVHIILGENFTKSDANGLFRIEIPASLRTPYQLILTHISYDTLIFNLTKASSKQLHLKMSPHSVSLEEVHIQSLRSVRTSISGSLITKKSLETQYVGQDLPYLLQYKTPSLTVSAQSGNDFSNYSQVQLRGMDERYINFSLSGIPLNDAIDHGFYFSNIADIGESVSAVHIQRGVGLSRGIASYAGSMDLALPTLFAEKSEGSFSIASGSFGTWKVAAQLRTGMIQKGTAAYIRLSTIHSEGYRRSSGTEGNSLFFVGGHQMKNQLLQVIFLSGKTNNSMAYAPVSSAVIDEDPRFNSHSPNEEDQTWQNLLALRYSRFPSAHSTLSTTLYADYTRNRFPFGFQDEDTYSSTLYTLDNRRVGVLANYQKESSQGLSWIVGGHSYFLLRRNTEAAEPNWRKATYYDQSQKFESSFFAHASQLWKRWELFANLQFRYISLHLIPHTPFVDEGVDIPAQEWVFANPKIGLSYQLPAHRKVYASIGLSQREPTRNDILGETNLNAGTIAAIQNESLDHSQLLDIEVGLTQMQGTLTGNINLFYMQFRNEILPIGGYIEAFYAQLRKNVPQSFRTGIEIDMDLSLSRRFAFSMQGSGLLTRIKEYQYEGSPEVFTDVPAGQSPVALWTGELRYTKPQFLVWLRGRYTGKAYLNPISEPRYTQSDFWLADTGFSWTITQIYDISFQLRNLFNTIPKTSGEASPTGELFFIPQAPLHVYLSLRMNL